MLRTPAKKSRRRERRFAPRKKRLGSRSQPRLEHLERRTMLAADLEILSLTVTAVTPDSISFDYTIINSGNMPANLDGPGGSDVDNLSVQAMLSRDPVHGGADDVVAIQTIVGTSPLGNLDPNQTFSSSLTANVSINPEERDYLTLLVDFNDIEAESDETNNTAADQFDWPELSFRSLSNSFTATPGSTMEIEVIATTGSRTIDLSGFQLNFSESDPALTLINWETDSTSWPLVIDESISEDKFVSAAALSNQVSGTVLGTATIRMPSVEGEYVLTLTGGAFSFRTNLVDGNGENLIIGDYAGDAGNGDSPASNAQIIRVVDDQTPPMGIMVDPVDSPNPPNVFTVTSLNTYIDIQWADGGKDATGIDPQSFHVENILVIGRQVGPSNPILFTDLGNGLVRYWYVDPESWNGSPVNGAQLIVVGDGMDVVEGDRFSIRASEQDYTFEFDRNARLENSDHVPVPYRTDDSQAKLFDRIVDAINAAEIPGVSAEGDAPLVKITGLTDHVWDTRRFNVTEGLDYLIGVQRYDVENGLQSVPSEIYDVHLSCSRPVTDNAQNPAVVTTGVYIADNSIPGPPVIIPSLEINRHFVDPPGSLPSYWDQQRSDIRTIHLNFTTAIELTADDIELIDMGVNAAEIDQRIDLSDRVSSNASGWRYTITFDRGELDDGIYSVRVLPGVNPDGSSRPEMSTHTFTKYTGDFTSFSGRGADAAVTIPDFAPIAFWFGDIVEDEPALIDSIDDAPAYVDLNNDQGISIFDFPIFRDQFGTGINFAPEAGDDNTATATDGRNAEGRPYHWISPLSGEGLRYLEVDGFLSVSDRNPTPPPFDPLQNRIVISTTDLIEDNDRDDRTHANQIRFGEIIKPAENGNLEVEPTSDFGRPNLIYTPDVDFFGLDTFFYTVSDTFGNQSSATVTIDVRRPAPTAVSEDLRPLRFTDCSGAKHEPDPSPAFPEGSLRFDIAADLLANDSDRQDGGLGTPALNGLGANGIIDLNHELVDNGRGGRALYDENDLVVGEVFINDTHIDIHPDPHEFGDFYFQYRIEDSHGLVDDARFDFTIKESQPNLDSLVVAGSRQPFTPLSNVTGLPAGHILDQPSDDEGNPANWPQSQSDLLGRDYVTDPTTPITLDVLGNDTDPGGGTLTITEVTLVDGPATVEVTENQLVITPTGLGAVEISYSVVGEAEVDATGTLSILIVDDAVIAQDDFAVVNENDTSGVQIDILRGTHSGCESTIAVCPGADLHPTSPLESLFLVKGSATNLQPQNAGVLEENPDQTFTFVPTAGFDGLVTFEYQVSDGRTTDTGLVTIEVLNEDPTANDDSATTTNNQGISINVLANDSDPQGDSFEVKEAGKSGGPLGDTEVGGFVVDNDTSVFYIPPIGFAGVDEFSYLIEDSKGNSQGSVLANETGESRATVTINVLASPRPERPDSFFRTPESRAKELDWFDSLAKEIAQVWGEN